MSAMGFLHIPSPHARLCLLVALWTMGAAAPAAAGAGPSAESLPAVTLTAAADAAGDLSRMHSLLVSWRGELILERYYNGTRPTRLANVKSVSKSVLSALVGIAIERGLVKNAREPIASFFPNLLKGEPDARKRAITVEDLLTMRSGLESTSSRNYGAWVRSPNWVRSVLRRPLVSDPGTAMEYSTGNSHLLSAIVTKASGTSTWQFAREALARPLGITLAPWPRDPQGIYFGGNEMRLTPRQMLAFGELYLNRGRANGRQVVPAEWVDASLAPHTRSRRWEDRFYAPPVAGTCMPTIVNVSSVEQAQIRAAIQGVLGRLGEITDDDLRECIERQARGDHRVVARSPGCETGTHLGYTEWTFLGPFVLCKSDDIWVCLDRHQGRPQKVLEDTLMHEWAHTCCWEDGEGGGVPG